MLPRIRLLLILKSTTKSDHKYYTTVLVTETANCALCPSHTKYLTIHEMDIYRHSCKYLPHPFYSQYHFLSQVSHWGATVDHIVCSLLITFTFYNELIKHHHTNFYLHS